MRRASRAAPRSPSAFARWCWIAARNTSAPRRKRCSCSARARCTSTTSSGRRSRAANGCCAIASPTPRTPTRAAAAASIASSSTARARGARRSRSRLHHPARRAGARRPRAHAGAARRGRSLRNRVVAILRPRAQSLPRAGARRSRAISRRRCHRETRRGLRRRDWPRSKSAWACRPRPHLNTDSAAAVVRRAVRRSECRVRGRPARARTADSRGSGRRRTRVRALDRATRELPRARAAPCGECQDCRWIAADQHPDVTRLSPEEDSTQIVIQPVRDLAADLALTAHGRGYKIAIVSPAEAMNHFAAQCAAQDARGAAAAHPGAAGHQPALATAADPAQPLLAPAAAGALARSRGGFSRSRARGRAVGRGAGRHRSRALSRCWTPIPPRSRSCATTPLDYAARHRQRQCSAAGGGRTLGDERRPRDTPRLP